MSNTLELDALESIPVGEAPPIAHLFRTYKRTVLEGTPSLCGEATEPTTRPGRDQVPPGHQACETCMRIDDRESGLRGRPNV